MPLTILIVDDDGDTRALLNTVVADAGFAPVLASDGPAALALLEAMTPDLILLDAIMPLLDGFETCRRIKAIESAAHVPVIFMTGLTDTQHVVRGLAAGGVDYVTKPLAIEELVARIHVHLGNARTTRSALKALDTAGGRLLASDACGRIRWATPDARRLIADLASPLLLDIEVALAALAGDAEQNAGEAVLEAGPLRIMIEYLGPTSAAEHLFRLSHHIEGMEAIALQQGFGLTPREADVLLWTARGKSNKDMSEILNISARTVNKHLEQIFIKMGVENRASAAAAATRVLLDVERRDRR
jgi:DNA-binding response OmpR family regulator/DNA-binding CsgD family transcriptional regulator